jgi:uncharacterized membrane protein
MNGAPPILHWIQSTPLSAWIRGSRAAIPIIETIHLLAMALAVGTIMVIDLSVLGVALRRESVPRIERELAAWTWTGFGVTLFTGILLFLAEAEKVGCKPVFWVKLALLAGAFMYHLTVHRQLCATGEPLAGARARLSAGLSLALWFGVAFGGKAIGLFG